MQYLRLLFPSVNLRGTTSSPLRAVDRYFGVGNTCAVATPDPVSAAGPALRRDRTVVIYLFLAALCLYLATGRFFIDNTDGENMFLSLEATLRGDLWLQPGLSGNWWRTWGWTGRPFDPHGLGQSIVAIPLWLVGNAVAAHLHFVSPDLIRRAAVLLFCPIVTALTVAFLYWFARRLGHDARLAMAAALIYGLCTLAWPFSKYFFSEPLAGLLLLVTLYYLSPASGPLTLASAAAAGALAGLTGLTRPALWPLCLAAMAFIPARVRFRDALPAALVFLLFLAPSAYLYGWYNWARFGSPLTNCPMDPNKLSLAELPVGLYGFLLSPGKSIFLYVPAVLLALAGLAALRRRDRLLAAAVLAVAACHILIYAAWTDWPGGWTWGPRFLISALPVLWLAMPDGLAWAGRTRRLRLAAAVVLILSLAVQVLGVTAFYMAHLDRIEASGRRIGSSHYHWGDTPILGAVWTLTHARFEPIPRLALGRTRAGARSSEGLKHELRNTLDLWPVFLRRFGFGRWVWAPFLLLLLLAALFTRAAARRAAWEVRRDTPL